MSKTAVALICLAIINVAGAQTRRPSTNVRRAASGTPEMYSLPPSLGSLENGKPAEVCLRGKANQFPTGNQKFTVDGACKLVKAAMNGATAACFTVVSNSEEGGSCYMEVRGSGGEGGLDRIASGGVEVKPTAAVEAQRQKEEEERRAKEAADAKEAQDTMANAPNTVGKKWSVVLPNGKNDTWTWTGEQFGGGKFKSSSGDEVTIMVQPGSKVMAIIGESCVFAGSLAGNKVTGQADLPPSMCKLGQGKWSATISK